jgi:Ricin-type beta-trefoil lectin domain-like/HEAT repeats/HEAT repeat
MPIDAECPICGHKGKVPDLFKGKQLKCRGCCNLFIVGDVPVALKAARSHAGSMKIPVAQSVARNGSGAPFGNLDVGNPSPVRYRRRRAPGKAFALVFWPFVLIGLGIGGWLAYNWVAPQLDHSQAPEQAKAESPARESKVEKETHVADKAAPKPPQVPDMVVDAAKGPARIGDFLLIRVKSVLIDVPTGRQIVYREKKFFLVKVQIENTGPRPVDYRGWSDPDPAGDANAPVLVDSVTNKYTRWLFGPGIKADGQSGPAAIQPGKWLDDLLVFEVPPGNAPSGTLELPAAVFSIEGKALEGKVKFLIQVPRDTPKPQMAKTEPPNPDPARPAAKPDPVEAEPAEVKARRLQLKSKLLPERREAAVKLGDLGAKAGSAVADLAALLRKDSSESVRLAAAEALGKIGPGARAGLPQLIEALQKDEFPLVHAAAAEALGRLGADARDALPALTQALDSKFPAVAVAAKNAILRIQGRAVPAEAAKPPEGFVKIINRNSGKVLGVFAREVADGGAVVQWAYEMGEPNQLWKMVPVEDGWVKIENQNSKTLLTVVVGAVLVISQEKKDAEQFQQWKLQPVEGARGCFKLVNRASGKVLGIDGNGKNDGDRPVLWTDAANTANLEWQLEKP